MTGADDPNRPTGVSSREFWNLFDRLSRQDRDRVNYAKNGPAVVDAWNGILMRLEPQTQSAGQQP